MKFIFVAFSLLKGMMISWMSVILVLLSIRILPLGMLCFFAVMESRLIPTIICFTFVIMVNFMGGIVYKTMSFFEICLY